MNDYKITLDNVSKSFANRLVFQNLSYEFTSNGIYGVTGKNGSGKTTLLKIISNILQPTKGKIQHFCQDKSIKNEKIYQHIGFVAPYLIFYDEFSAIENFTLLGKIKGKNFDSERSNEILKIFELYERRNEPLISFSSGMKQRVKFIFALLNNPSVLILDEPTTNLDKQGKEIFYDLIKKQKSKIIIIASNDSADLTICNNILNIEDFVL
ncbi:MAG: ABC transporter ATP-binding protein [Ignavibacteriales bacterium]|nr:ABC transporter ATP-binding protein [Ignavibacteriales bacterium]